MSVYENILNSFFPDEPIFIEDKKKYLLINQDHGLIRQ